MLERLTTERWRNEGHIPESLLVAFLDAEVSAGDSAAIEAHLSSCWACRSRRQKAEAAIASFVDYQDSWHGTAVARPPKGWKEFEHRLERLAADAMERPFWLRIVARLRAASVPQLAWKSAWAALVVTGLLVWYASRDIPAVSAKHVLDQAGTAEAVRLRAVARPVVYQKIAVRRTGARPQSGTVEMWTEPGRGQGHRRGQDQLWSDLERIYRVNRIPTARPLSIDTFRSWRLGIQPAVEQVIPASTVVAVRTTASGPAAVDRIVRGEIVIRRSDWHPIKQTWRVEAPGGLDEYELTEMDFAVTAIEAAPPELFAEPPAIAAVPAAVPLPHLPGPPAPPVPPAAALPTAEVLEEVEMSARYRLHQRGECLTGALEILREQPDRIAIRGTSETAARKDELAAALATLPFIDFDVEAVEEPGAPAPAGPVKRDAPPGTTEWVALADAAVSFSQTVRKEGWALDRLARRYGKSRGSGLSPGARTKLETMVRDHLGNLRTLLATGFPRLRRALHELAGQRAPDATAPPTGAPEARWAALCLGIAHDAESLDDAVQRTFTSGAAKPENARAALDWLASLDSQLAGADDRVAVDFARHGALAR